MQFSRAEIVSLTFCPNEKKDPTASLKLSAELTPELAEKMRCREAVFRPDDKPHPNVTRLDLGGATLRDIDLTLPSSTMEGAFDTYRPEDISSFRIEVDGMLVRLYMLARIKGRYLELVDFLEKQNTDNFEMAIRSMQQEFDWSGKGGTGERVDMSAAGKKERQGPLFEQPACVHCDAETPRNADGMHMIEGDLVACPRPNPEASNEGEKRIADGPALPAIHETNGGRRKRQLTRGEVARIDRNEHPEMRGDIAAEHHPADAEPVFPVN